MAKSHRDLLVFQKAVVLAGDVYRLTQSFPREEMYAISAQMRRAATSVPANIAEGNARGTKREYARFLTIARGSLLELDALLLVALNARLVNAERLEPFTGRIDEISRMLYGLRERILDGDDSRRRPPPMPLIRSPTEVELDQEG